MDADADAEDEAEEEADEAARKGMAVVEAAAEAEAATTACVDAGADDEADKVSLPLEDVALPLLLLPSASCPTPHGIACPSGSVAFAGLVVDPSAPAIVNLVVHSYAVALAGVVHWRK